MRRSVRLHLLLNGLAVSLITVLAVGVVTLLLVNSYFDRQEEQYLSERGENLVEPLERVLRYGSAAELHQIASLGLISNQVRVQVIDTGGQVLVDSGSLDDLIPGPSDFAVPELVSRFQFFLDNRGHLTGFGFPFDDNPQYVDPFAFSGFDDLGGGDFPVVSFTRSEPISELSGAEVDLPLQIGDQVVGYARISEGPAFGVVIRDSVQKALLVGGLAAILVAALAALVSARQITRPLQDLSLAAEQMAEGSYEARAPSSRLKEYDQLANQFNIMATQLSETIESLEADRAALRRFIADASHELRTPLTALMTFNQLLVDHVSREQEPEATFVAESAVQLAQLDQLTSDLLDLSRLESRLSGTDFAVADLRLPVERAYQGLRSQSQAKNQQMDFHVPSAPVMVSHDPSAIERAVRNMLANGIKYTPKEGRILLSLEEAESTAEIQVQDNGPGIPESELPLIFDRFYRGRNHKVEGSGLGLSIAQEIAAIHGGKVTVKSTEGLGSTFTLALPKASAAR